MRTHVRNELIKASSIEEKQKGITYQALRDTSEISVGSKCGSPHMTNLSGMKRATAMRSQEFQDSYGGQENPVVD